MPRPMMHAGAIPVLQKGLFRPARFAPTDAMADGGMARRHRLAVQPDHLAQASRDACLRVGELDALGANPAAAAPDAALWVDQRHVMLRPRQILPRPIPTRSDPSGSSATSAAAIAPHATAFDPNRQPTLRRRLVVRCRHHAKPRQPQYPGTISTRSHRSSLVVSTSRENTIQSWMVTWDRFVVQAAEQTAHPKCGPRRRPGTTTSDRCTQIR
jgi:hypothetical protein